MGLKGGVICFLYSKSQSMAEKKGCSLSSAASRLAPRRFCGFRLRSYVICQLTSLRLLSDEVHEAYPLDKLLAVIANYCNTFSPQTQSLRNVSRTYHVWGTGSCRNLRQVRIALSRGPGPIQENSQISRYISCVCSA